MIFHGPLRNAPWPATAQLTLTPSKQLNGSKYSSADVRGDGTPVDSDSQMSMPSSGGGAGWPACLGTAAADAGTPAMPAIVGSQSTRL